MKLRNKKTGDIWDLGKILLNDYPSYDTLESIVEDFEDYEEPLEPLIKDEKIRKAVRAWADYHKTTEVQCNIGTWDHAGVCLFDSVLQLNDYNNRIVMQFFMDSDKREKIKEGVYTIAELCGEEEE